MAISNNERGVGQKHVLLLASTGRECNEYIALHAQNISGLEILESG